MIRIKNMSIFCSKNIGGCVMNLKKNVGNNAGGVLSMIAAFIALTLLQSSIYAQANCRETAFPALPDVTITSITQETEYAPHCKVAGVIGKEIKFELLLPENWNGKFVMGGGGGFAGSVVNVALQLGAVQKGYATVGTDTGHEGHGLDASWALDNMERIVNFGHLAVHRTAVTAKALIEAYYGQKIKYSYFFGCSGGGGQAMKEAQRYAEDFDGIVAGAPAYNWTLGVAAGMTQNMKYMYPDPNNLDEPLLSQKDLELIESTYLAQCDELDGIKDGILNDPRQCDFDIESLLCMGKKTDSCLTKEQVEAAKAIYEGPKDSDGNLFYGFPLGGETEEGGWFLYLTGGLNYSMQNFQEGVTSEFAPPVIPCGQYGFGMGIMQNMVFHDTSWTYADYDYDDFREDARVLGKTLNATSPDLSEFRKKGGKLLMFNGWSDPSITALGTIGYYEDVIAHDQSAAEDVRLFMMPGVLHCAGGIGPWYVNWIDEIDKWVAGVKAPGQITVYFIDENMQPSGSRLLCAYPNIAKYDGKGDTRDVSSFSCSAEE